MLFPCLTLLLSQISQVPLPGAKIFGMHLGTGRPSCRPNPCLPGFGGSLQCWAWTSGAKSFLFRMLLSTTCLSALRASERDSFPMRSSLIQVQCPSQVRGLLLKSTCSPFLRIKEVPQGSGLPRTSAFEKVLKVTQSEGRPRGLCHLSPVSLQSISSHPTSQHPTLPPSLCHQGQALMD